MWLNGRSRLRPLFVAVLLTAATSAACAWLWPDLVAVAALRHPGVRANETLDQALGHLCGSLAFASLLWLWLCGLLSVVDVLRGRAQGRRGCPLLVRRLVFAACGFGLVVSAAPSHALDDEPTPLEGLTVPTLPSTGPTEAAPPPAVMVVRPGDCLWRLAERSLPAGATPAHIARVVARLHALNRHEIGPDPDLIRPGLRLRLPTPMERNPR